MTESAFSRRTLLKSGVALGGLALLSACAPTGPSQSTGPATLRFMTNNSATEEQVFRQVVDQYMAANPDITVEYLNIADIVGYQTKLRTLAAADDLPDVFFTRTAEIASQGRLGWNLDLTKYADANADPDDIWPAMREQMTYEGQLMGLPYDFSNMAIYYNKTMFEQEGIELPSGGDVTWEEYFELAAAFKRVEGGQQTRWGTSVRFDDWFWVGVFESFGGGVFNDDQTECTAAREENVEALTLFIEQYEKGVAPIAAALPQGVDAFAAGLVAMQPGGSWATQSRRDAVADKFEWDVFQLPSGPDGTRAISANGASFGVSASTRYPELSQQFATYLAAPDQLRTFIVEPLRGIPGRPTVAEEWKVAAESLPPANNGMFLEQMENAIDFTYPAFWSDYITSWVNRVTSLTKPGDVQAALQGLQDDVNRAIF